MITSKYFKTGDRVVLTHDLSEFGNKYELIFIPRYFSLGYTSIVERVDMIFDKNRCATQVFSSKGLLFYSDAFELMKLDISSPKDVSLNLLRRLRNV